MTSHNPLLGIALIVGAVILFPVKDAFAKLVGGVYSPALIIWAQFAFMSLVLLPVVLYQEGWRGLWPKFMGIQIARGVAVVTGVGLFYWAITFIPLADATAVSFVTPLIVTALSTVVLGEHVGFRRWAAVVFGFAGVIIILRPDLGGERVGYIIALGTGVCLSIFYLFNRKLAAVSPPMVSVFYSAAIGAVLLTPAIPFLWVPPRPGDAAVITAFLVFATVGQSFMVLAFKYADASLIAPFQYCAIIVTSGIYIALREGRLDKAPRLSAV